MGFFPIFRSLFISLSHIDDAFECFNTEAHARVELGLHGVQMVMHVLAETNEEGEGLLQVFALQVVLHSQL